MKIFFLKIIFSLVFVLSPFVASASATEHNMSGFAWSSNIGWISFNNTSGGGAISYGVNKDASGNLVGHAWSPNIGWIKFGGLSGFPSGAGTTASDAKVVGTSLVGWARACAGMNDVTVSPNNQSVANNTCTGWSRTDGWDGWISLSGTGYGVTLTDTGSTLFSQYTCATDCVWGSDVVGWVDFSGVIIGPATFTVTPSVAGSSGTISPSTVQTVNSGATSTFTVDATGASQSYSIGGSCPRGSPWEGGASSSSYTTNPIDANCTVVANFSTDTFPPITRPPNVTTPTPASGVYVTGTSVTLGAKIEDLGNPPTNSAGIVWSTSPNPNTSNYVGIDSVSVAGTGEYTIPPETFSDGTYYFKGFATNSAGTDYSDDGTFTIGSGISTPGQCPVIIKGSNKHCVPNDTFYAGDYRAYPSIVKWTCNSASTPPGVPKECSEPIGPGFKEN